MYILLADIWWHLVTFGSICCTSNLFWDFNELFRIVYFNNRAKVLTNVTKEYQRSPNVTKCHYRSPKITKGHQILPNVATYCQRSPKDKKVTMLLSMLFSVPDAFFKACFSVPQKHASKHVFQGSRSILQSMLLSAPEACFKACFWVPQKHVSKHAFQCPRSMIWSMPFFVLE